MEKHTKINTSKPRKVYMQNFGHKTYNLPFIINIAVFSQIFSNVYQFTIYSIAINESGLPSGLYIYI